MEPARPDPTGALAQLVGSGRSVPCLGGVERPAVELDQAASTQAHPAVAERVAEFLPWYSSVHRGAGFRSRRATVAYEDARRAVLEFAGRDVDGDDVAILCRNTTEAINHLAYRLRLAPDDVVVTTVVEHHANLLPWGRVAERRYVGCGTDGTFDVDDVSAALDAGPRRPALLAVTGASNVSGWLPPIDAIIDAAHRRGVPVLVDAAQLAPHRPLPAHADFLALSGHKLYAPFGCGALVGPRAQFESGDPFLAGGGAVDLVGLDEVIWTAPPDREEAGSPNVVGAVALHAALDVLGSVGWDAVEAHEVALASRLHHGLGEVDGVRLLGPVGAGRTDAPTLPVAAFTVEGMHHALVAARLSAEYGIAVRHGCFCAHPYVIRLLGMDGAAVDAYRREVLRGDHRRVPGAVRASAGLGTSGGDVDALVAAVGELAAGSPPPVPYEQDAATGDFFPVTDEPAWRDAAHELGAACSADDVGRHLRSPGAPEPLPMSLRTRRAVVAAVAVTVGLVLAGSGLAGCATGSATPATGPVVYAALGAGVPDPGSTVAVVDADRGTVGTPVTVGTLPAALALVPGDRDLLVAVKAQDQLVEVSTASGAVVRRVGVGLEPDAVAVTPDGTTALVANSGDGTVTAVHLPDLTAGATVAVGRQPVAVAVTPDGTRALVANFGDGTLTPVSLPSLAAGPAVAVGPEPSDVLVASDGATALVTGFQTSSVTPVALPAMVAGPAVPIGADPTGIAASPGSPIAWISAGDGVTPFAVANRQVGNPVAIGAPAACVATAPGGTVWVCSGDGALVEVDPAKGRVVRTVALGGLPAAAVVSAPAGG